MQGEYRDMKKQSENNDNLLKHLNSPATRFSNHIEIDNGCYITVEGCEGVLRYGEENILLGLGSRTLQILGTNLCISNMFAGTVCIRGKINSVEFLFRR